MVDFSKLMSKKGADIKRPPVLPGGTYFGVVGTKVLGESKNKKTPQIEFPVQLTRAGEDVDQDILARENIDVSKKKFSGGTNRGGTFYLTDEAEYRLVEFIKTFGVSVDEMSLGEMVEVPIGREVMVTIAQGISERSGEPFNTLESMVGVA